MNRIIGLFAGIVLCLTFNVASAQSLAPNQSTQKGLFCDLCKIQNCSCSNNQCVNCGLTTGMRKTTSNDTKITEEVCGKAKGRMRDGRCMDR